MVVFRKFKGMAKNKDLQVCLRVWSRGVFVNEIFKKEHRKKNINEKDV